MCESRYLRWPQSTLYTVHSGSSVAWSLFSTRTYFSILMFLQITEPPIIAKSAQLLKQSGYLHIAWMFFQDVLVEYFQPFETGIITVASR
jgi:hypothetical protein